MKREDIKAQIPHIKDTFDLKSDPDEKYNCFEWAVGSKARFWDCDKPGYYWPEGVPRDWKLNSIIQAYECFKFLRCENGQFEVGFEKIAIYCETKGDEVLHAARLLPNQRWTSKLGPHDDIEHDHYSELEHERKAYGRVVAFMKRPV